MLSYTALFSFIIFRVKFFQRFSISPKLIVAIFIVKVLAGIFYGFIHEQFYYGGDTLSYFNDSKIIVGSLTSGHIHEYLKLVFGINTRPPDPDIRPYAAAMSYWNDMSAYSIVRFHALSSLFSLGYYYVDVVFYNFFTLIGLLYLFLFFLEILSDKKYFLLIVVFFFPSILFWSSGIHKDGISLAALGLLLYFLKQIMTPDKIFHRQNVKNFIGFLLGFWILVVVRNFWLLLLIPGLIAFAWTIRSPKHILVKFIFTYIIYFGITTNLNYIQPDWDFLNILVVKQNDFLSLKSESKTLEVQPLIPSLPSVAEQIPTSISNCLLRPWLSDVKNPLRFCAAVENVIVILILVLTVVFIRRNLNTSQQSLLFLSLFFSFTIFIVTGIAVPVLGALVRYKMIGVLFLLISSVVLTRPFSFGKSVSKQL
ncbi:MAG TPA: hypothetical protein VE978_06360 [Chitinophagales bacterium]|nr:hypothetical protein [Chitinophagales bacterium]